MRYTKTILLLTRIATALFAVMMAINFIVPVLSTKTLNVNIFTILMCVCWTFTILSANGFFKKIVSNIDGEIIYDTIIPIMPATLIRLVELGWFYLKHRSDFKIGVFLIDVILDVVFVVILLADKSNYYYMSVEEDEDA